MNRFKTLAAALLLGGSAAALAANTDGEFRLNELLTSNTEYREAWQDLIRDEERLPEWVINLSGIAKPMKTLEEDGDSYLVGQLCETSDCFNQRLYVAFSQDGDDAYALWVQVPAGLPKDKTPSKHADLRWLGEPDDGIKQLLQEQLKKDPNWY
ncbi:inhibitor of vertebrate lysozyme family protein [Pseudomonas sp. CNPSo 3701]|uniref:inhibitor of vertebrate lysozyme family protein n=1 Tax=Pseudomonas sp. CNPSo 3701 TaxID=3027943 RepID=UPI0023633E71|nr:inhibitor of vertebrate lysozyme family protein [Pseudomonas sp. CNPSo 3701]MDD1510250.1 inhibitor of vertebrate lysozyme family protein [Pseudomonas sp. CNPSo 3701]